MRAGPKQSKTVTAVYNHIGTSGMKSHVRMASYTKELDSSYPAQKEHWHWESYTWGTMWLTRWVSGLGRQSTGQALVRTSKTHITTVISVQSLQELNKRRHFSFIETPQTTWEQLGLDIFSLWNTQYLLKIYYFSRFPVVKQLQSLHSLSVIKHLKDIFTEIGIPRCIVSDGGTQFTSQDSRLHQNMGHTAQDHITNKFTV